MPPRAAKPSVSLTEPTHSIRVSETTYATIQAIAEKEGCWLRSVVDRAVKDYAEKKK